MLYRMWRRTAAQMAGWLYRVGIYAQFTLIIFQCNSFMSGVCGPCYHKNSMERNQVASY